MIIDMKKKQKNNHIDEKVKNSNWSFSFHNLDKTHQKKEEKKRSEIMILYYLLFYHLL